jgi:hypothetical protein
MFLESQNLAIVRTELDEVFFQNFDYDGTDPGIATARTGNVFKPIATTHAQYIGEVNSNVGLWNAITEVQTVPVGTPKVTNKYTIAVADFAKAIPLSKNMFDDNMKRLFSPMLNFSMRVV